jgi:hypothetical protein
MTAYVDELWYVLVDNQSYGPYGSAYMVNFVGEGRVIESSLISKHPQNGFLPAVQFPNFQHWVQAAMQAQAPQTQPAPITAAPQAEPYSPSAGYRAPKPDSPQENLFLVMAEINPQTGMRFLRSLQSFGHVQRIGDTVWLLKGTHELQEINAALSKTLAKRDRLFIHDCFANQQAWENIGADLDDRIRQIWQDLKR